MTGHSYLHVIVDFWLLSIAVLLLWFPRQWLRFGWKVIATPVKKTLTDKDLRDSNDVSLRLKDELRKPRNWIDGLRAAAGGIGVCLVCFEVPAQAPKDTNNVVFSIQAAVLVIAVAIQMVRFQNRLTLVAPVFFIFGLSFALLGWQAALFACVTIWVLNLLIPSVGFFLIVFAGLEMIFGRLLASNGSSKMVFLAAFLAIGPVLFSAMTNRRLARLNKKNRSKSVKM